MSGWSEAQDCPYCRDEERTTIEYTLEAEGDGHNLSGVCLVCGYSYHTVEEQLALDEVNKEREIREMEPLTELKPSTFKADSKEH